MTYLEEICMIKADLSEPLLFNHDMSINVSYGHYYDTFPTHWHNFMEIIAPLTGDYYATIGTEEKKLNENHIAIIPPRTLHAIRTSNEEPNLIIQFSCGLFQQLHDFMAHRQTFYAFPVINIRDSSFEENPLDLLLEIRDCFFRDAPFRELQMYEALLHFFILLGKHNYTEKNKLSAQKTPKQKAYEKKFVSISNYINEHCTGPISLEETASYAGFSKYHFSRIFKEYYQMSFPEFVTAQRISKAAELLENPTLSVVEIAMQSGFSNLSSFNRAFKQINHCTPSQFRKMADVFPAS